jgi:hypothetical protein
MASSSSMACCAEGRSAGSWLMHRRQSAGRPLWSRRGAGRERPWPASTAARTSAGDRPAQGRSPVSSRHLHAAEEFGKALLSSSPIPHDSLSLSFPCSHLIPLIWFHPLRLPFSPSPTLFWSHPSHLPLSTFPTHTSLQDEVSSLPILERTMHTHVQGRVVCWN